MPVNKIHYGAMYVTPDSKRPGAYCANLPLVWEGDKTIMKMVYFGMREYTNPKLQADRYVDRFLTAYYGEERAGWIRSLPQFIHKMKFGCSVNVMDTTTVSRGKRFKKIAVCWTEYEFINYRYKSKRCQKSWLYNDNNRIERMHVASLFAAQKRAETTFSTLHESALNFEYDLEC